MKNGSKVFFGYRAGLKGWQTLTLVLLAGISCAHSTIQWKYPLTSAFKISQTSNHAPAYTINYKILDYYLDRIAQNATDFPPQFVSASEKQEIQKQLNQMILFLEPAHKTLREDPRFLLRAGRAYHYCHNLDLSAVCAPNAESMFLRLLQLEPDNAEGNYRFARFLFGTKKRMEAIPYAEKAVALGIDDARWVLGILYAVKGDKKTALEHLEVLQKSHPEYPQIVPTIEAIEHGRLRQFQK